MKQQCPAKVNLFLEVTGRRPDGYHTLATLFAKINIYDVLELEFADGQRPRLAVVDELDSGVELSAGEDNLVMRAAAAFYREFGVRRGVAMTLIKRIPMGAGLGGGSSDAAGALLGLSRLFRIEVTAARRKKLFDIGVKLGADVPFFLQPANFCRAGGIGDRLKPVRVTKSLPYMILAWPGFGSPTGPVYKALPLPKRNDVLTRLKQLSRLQRSLERGRPIQEWGGQIFNRLEQAQLPVMAEIARARAVLEAAGATAVRMSGSGSCVFGFVASHAEGERVLGRLKPYPWKVYLTSCHG